MKGIAAKAWNAGLNVIRLNQRTCGATEHLTRSLYNCGLSGDIEAVLKELMVTDRLSAISVIGYSMGGNLVLKMAGEVADTLPSLLGVFAVCPVINPAQCVTALERPENRLYHNHFLNSLKSRMIRKAHLYPGRWDLRPLRSIQTIREFDAIYTAPDGGYQSAAHYYELSGAHHVLHHIRVTTVIITADDDPFVPRATFDIPAIIANPSIHLITTRHGGHCGFFQRRRPDEDSYWVENRLIELISSEFGHPLI
jgi:predicted alpha/beta-fold hydrolase